MTDQMTKEEFYRAMMIVGGLRYYTETHKQLHRALTPTTLLAAAGHIIGKKYEHG